MCEHHYLRVQLEYKNYVNAIRKALLILSPLFVPISLHVFHNSSLKLHLIH
jgi:hypothetical protein